LSDGYAYNWSDLIYVEEVSDSPTHRT